MGRRNEQGIEQGMQKGRKEGLEKGMKEEKYVIAVKMKVQDFDPDVIL